MLLWWGEGSGGFAKIKITADERYQSDRNQHDGPGKSETRFGFRRGSDYVNASFPVGLLRFPQRERWKLRRLVHFFHRRAHASEFVGNLFDRLITFFRHFRQTPPDYSIQRRRRQRVERCD